MSALELPGAAQLRQRIEAVEERLAEVLRIVEALATLPGICAELNAAHDARLVRLAEMLEDGNRQRQAARGD